MADKGKQKVHDESESTRDSGMEALARVLERLIMKNEREDGIDEKKVDLIIKAVKPFPQNREEVCRWFDILEPVIKTMCVNDATKYTALVTLLGGERFSQVSMEAQNKGQEPEATYIWLKEQVVATFSKKRTVRSLMKQILARRLDRNESIEQYRAEIEMQVRQLCDSIKEVADDEEKLTELIGEIMIGGLPRHMRLQVKNSLTGEKFKTENIERVVNNIQTEAEHSYKNLKKNSPQKKTGAWRETKSEEEGMQHTQREQQKSPTRRDITCYRCQQKRSHQRTLPDQKGRRTMAKCKT